MSDKLNATKVEEIEMDNLLKGMDNQKSRWINYKVSLLTGGGNFLDGYNILIASFALIGIRQVFHPSLFVLGFIGTAVILGDAIGGFVSGYVTDRMGRKLLFLLDLIFFVVFAGAQFFVTNIPELVTLRVLVGFGIGMDFPIATSYMSEFSPVKNRGKFLALNPTFFNIAGIVVVLVYLMFTVFHVPSEIAWRYLLASSVVPAIILLIFRIGMPESPRWLISKGKTEDARRVIEEVTGNKYSGTIKTVIPKKSRYYLELFQSFARDAIFLGVFFLLFQIAFVGNTIFAPEFEASLHIPSIASSMIYWILIVVGDLICIAIIDPFGRKRSSLLGWAGMVATYVVLFLAPVGNSILLIAGFTLFALFVGIGPGSTHLMFSPELFPTRVRATAEGWKQLIGRLGAVLVGTFVLPALILRNEVLLIIAISVIGFLWTLLLAKETKGKSLEDLTESSIRRG
jgi:putative MFS transporter